MAKLLVLPREKNIRVNICLGKMNDIDIDMIAKTQLLKDSLNGLLVSFPKDDSCHGRRTLVVYKVEDPDLFQRGDKSLGPPESQENP